MFDHVPNIQANSDRIKRSYYPFVGIVPTGVVVIGHTVIVPEEELRYNDTMAETQNEEVEEETNDEFVTHSQLESLLDEKLGAVVERLTGDSLPDTETTEELDEVVGNMSPRDIEAMLEKKVAEAMSKLSAKKAARPATKKSAPKPPPAVEEPTDADESKPSLPGKKTLSERLWGK